MRRLIALALASVFVCLSAAPAFAASRTIGYPSQNPTSEQFNGQARFQRLAFGSWMRDALGSTLSAGGVYNNLTVSPNGGMYVAIGPTTSNTLGTLYQLAVDDPNPMPAGTWTPQLSADSTKIIIQGQQSGPSGSLGPISAPSSGLSQYYLVEAQIETVDTTPISMTFLNSAGTPSTLTENSVRQDEITYQLKAGSASTSPSEPSVDSGWIGLAYILVPGGTSAIASNMITALPPFAGFVANGSNVTLSGLTLTGASAGCPQVVTENQPIQVLPCTSGLGTVQGTNPITVSQASGVATVSCPNCASGVSATSPITASISSNVLGISLGTVPISLGGTGQTSLPTGILQYSPGSGITATSAVVTGLTAGTGIAVGTGTTPSVSLSHGDYVSISPGSQQSGSINVSGAITGGSSGTFSGALSATSATLSSATPVTYSSTTGVTVSSDVTGANDAFDYNAANATQPTGSLVNFKANGTSEFSVSMSGAVTTSAGATVNGVLTIAGATHLNTIIPTSSTAIFAVDNAAVTQNNLSLTDAGNMTVAGTITATNFYVSSRREWKKNITPYQFDALDLLNHVDYAEYDCKTVRCGPVGLHKVGLIANDTPWQIAGKQHDHEDAFAMAAIDGKAIVELEARVSQQQGEITSLTYGFIFLFVLFGCLGVVVVRRI